MTSSGHVTDIRAKQTRLDEAYLYERKVDDATYYDQRDQLREDLVLAQLALSEAVDEDFDVEGLLAYGEHVLTHASALWTAAEPTLRRQIQTVLFPTGLEWFAGRI